MTVDTLNLLLCPQCGRHCLIDASAYNAALVWACTACGWQKVEAPHDVPASPE